MPLIGKRSYNLFIPAFPTYEPTGKDQLVFNDEYVTAEIGQVGTQFDGPGHVGKRMKMGDGTTTEVFYNGHTTQEMRSPYGLLKLGVENVKPIITKGIFLIRSLQGGQYIARAIRNYAGRCAQCAGKARVNGN